MQNAYWNLGPAIPPLEREGGTSKLKMRHGELPEVRCRRGCAGTRVGGLARRWRHGRSGDFGRARDSAGRDRCAPARGGDPHALGEARGDGAVPLPERRAVGEDREPEKDVVAGLRQDER